MSQVALYDGRDAESLRVRLGMPRVALYCSVSSTMDVGHVLASGGAEAGTLVLADRQTAGRGRGGRRWSSASGAGVWFTLIERLEDRAALRVLSLRVGLCLARVLDRYATAPVRLKWPNDLYVGAGKLAGVLAEVRWTAGRPEWVAIGVGINVRLPAEIDGAAALCDPDRVRLLEAVLPAVREAAQSTGILTESELSAFAERDLARGRVALTPAAGRVAGIDAEGHILIAGPTGIDRFGSGSLVLEPLPHDPRT
ncbi:MAG: Bifunctional ligase/repressor BirA [Gemmatimonadaceae bacterium]|nr:Bifunctional ligase/repressor BirA [Gemmatimonadaceae bacterium]